MLLSLNESFTHHYTDALMTMQLPCNSLLPTLIAVGVQETIPARQAAKKLAACLQISRSIIVPGVGHVWNAQKPDLLPLCYVRGLATNHYRKHYNSLYLLLVIELDSCPKHAYISYT